MRTSWLLVSIAVHGAAVTAALGFGVYNAVSAARPPAKIEIQQQRAQASATPQTVPTPEVETEDVMLVEALHEIVAEAPPAEVAPEATTVTEDHLLVTPSVVLNRVTLERVRPPEPEPLPEKSEPVEPVPVVSVPQAYVEAQRSDNQAPDYPAKEHRLGREGIVVVRVFVAASGSVEQVELLKPSRYPGFNREAMRAARQWRFSPAIRDGAAVASQEDIDVVFRLTNRR